MSKFVEPTLMIPSFVPFFTKKWCFTSNFLKKEQERDSIVFRHKFRSSKILVQRYTVGRGTHARDFPSTMANLFQNFFLNFFLFWKKGFSNVEKRKKKERKIESVLVLTLILFWFNQSPLSFNFFPSMCFGVSGDFFRRCFNLSCS